MNIGTITQHGMVLSTSFVELPAQWSSNFEVSVVLDSDFLGYSAFLSIGYFDGEKKDSVLVAVADGTAIIPHTVYEREGAILISLTLTKDDETLNTNPVYVNVKGAPEIKTDVDPSDPSVLSEVESLVSSAISAFEDEVNIERSVLVTLPASGWSNSAPYEQTVNVRGVNTSQTYLAPVVLSTGIQATDEANSKALACISGGETLNGAIRLYCYDEKPTTDLTVYLTLMVVGLPDPGESSVTSVNGQTGDVVLTASDVGALPSNTTYVSSVNGSSGAVVLTIPTKTSDLTNDSGYITSAPVSSVNGQTGAVVISNATTSSAGLMSSTDKTKLEAVYADYSSALTALGV